MTPSDTCSNRYVGWGCLIRQFSAYHSTERNKPFTMRNRNNSGPMCAKSLYAIKLDTASDLYLLKLDAPFVFILGCTERFEVVGLPANQEVGRYKLTETLAFYLLF